MIRDPMLDNIFCQADSLRDLLEYHTGPGSSALQRCADALRQCSGRIVFSGMGASFFAALPAAQVLERHGRRVCHAEASELLHFGQGSWHPNDVAILISRSGRSIETLELTRKLKDAGVTVLAVTNVPDTPMTAAAQQTLHIASRPDELIAVQTYTGTLVTLLLLAERACFAPHRLAAECLSMLPVLEQYTARTFEQSEGWKEFFVGRGPLYLLGRGSALAALSEGALLFHETAKRPCLAMSSGQFRHGPVEVVGSDFRALVVGSPEPTRVLDDQLARDLLAMNAGVRWLGPQRENGARTPLPSLVPWPDAVPTSLTPIFDIVPLQIAAYQTALWNDIRPGDFRYASEVTDKESGFPLFAESLP